MPPDPSRREASGTLPLVTKPASQPLETFATGFGLPECPRWHDGALWMSDMWGRASHRLDSDGGIAETISVGDEQGGLGWLPDGRMLIVGMEHAKLWRIEADGPVEHADLRPWTQWGLNDMAVAGDGTAYVSHFGYDYHGGTGTFAPASLFRVQPDGTVDEPVDDLYVPNGVAISPSGDIFVAEPGASRISRLSFGSNGSLTQRHVFAQLTPVEEGRPAPPDGICLDEAGGVWAAEPVGKRVLHFDASGTLDVQWHLPDHPLAVVLGGPQRRDLYVCLTGSFRRESMAESPSGRVAVTKVDVPGTGTP
jgi:sugar lactone lactonase YvrE